jgi:hypothetical protein
VLLNNSRNGDVGFGIWFFYGFYIGFGPKQFFVLAPPGDFIFFARRNRFSFFGLTNVCWLGNGVVAGINPMRPVCPR